MVATRKPDPTASPSASPSGSKTGRALRILRIGLIVVLSTISLTTCTLIIMMISTNDKKLEEEIAKVQYKYTVSTFSAFLLLYLGVFTLLMKRLKNYYPKFYHREKT